VTQGRAAPGVEPEREASGASGRDDDARALRRRYRTGIALGVLGATAFGSGSVAAKLAYDSGLNAITLIAGRLTLGSIILWAIIAALGVPRAMPRRTRLGLLLVVGPTFAAQGVLIFESVARISVTTMSFVLYLYPALVALASAVVFGERLGRARAGALGLSLAGLTLIVGVPSGDVRTFGGVLALAAAVDTAIYLLLLRRAGGGVHPLMASASVLTGAAVAVCAGGLITGQLRPPTSAVAWAWIALHASLVATAVVAIVAAVGRVGATRTAIATTWEPVAAALLAALLLAERPTLMQILGGVVVVAAAALLALLGPDERDTEDTRGGDGGHDLLPDARTVRQQAELARAGSED
jgi:drug/metabolite transporter (DMT)-like permease